MSKRSSVPVGKSITVKDVAQYAGVSVATVSRVLNQRETVDPELRLRVQNAVERLKYRPNRLARNLRTNSTTVIALVVPDIQNPFFVAVSRGVEEAALREGYTLLVCNTDDDIQHEAHYFQVLRDESIAGVILCSADERLSHAAVQASRDHGMAVVALDRRVEGIAIDSILSDNFGGSRLAVSHLIERGHRQIALIGASDIYAPGRERRLGYEQAFHDYGLAVDRDLIKVTDFRATNAEAATEALLDRDPAPTALFVCNGVSAIGALRAINRRGLRVPDQIALVVFDDLDWLEAYSPPITAVSQNTRQLGITAADQLLRRINGDPEPVQERRLPTQLIVRQSTPAL
jgi:LacI family transcriptional regulator